MRPFVFFFTFFFFFSAAVPVAARTDIINSRDKQITYGNPGWRKMDAPGGEFMYLRRDRGNASLTVLNATQIGVTVMVQTSGDTVRILLDNTDHVITPISALEPAWNSSILNPSVPHKITIVKENPAEQYLSLYSFSVTYPDLPSIDTTSTPSSTETENPTKQPEGQPDLTATTKIAIAGAVVGAVCLGLLGALGIYFWRRRKKHDATLDPFRKVEGGTSPFHSTDALYTRTDGVSPLVGEGGTSALPLEGTAPFQPPPSSPSDQPSAPPPYIL